MTETPPKMNPPRTFEYGPITSLSGTEFSHEFAPIEDRPPDLIIASQGIRVQMGT